MEDNDLSDDTLEMNKPITSRRHISKRLVVLLLLVVGVFGYCSWRYYRIVKAPLDVSNATTAQALSWFALRDLSSEPEEKRSELFELYFSKITGGSGELSDRDKIEIPSSLQGVASSFLKSADQKVESWNKNRVRPPFARVDYVVQPTGDHPSNYVLSSDVKPGPGLQKRWQERQVAVVRGSVHTPTVERNVQTLLMQWFVDRCKRYDVAPDDKKKETLERYAAELLKLQAFYNKFRVSGGQTPLSREHQLREFERVNEGWLEFASVDELAKVMWFKDLLTTVIVLQEVGVDGSKFYPPTIRKDAANENDSSDKGGDSPSDAAAPKRPAKRVLDVVNRYLFVGKKRQK